MNSQSITVVSFYKFHQLSQARVSQIESFLHDLIARHKALGLVILGQEGINTTLSCATATAGEFRDELIKTLDIGPLEIKESYCSQHPFHEFVIKIRDEIVTLHRPGMVPSGKHRHLSPQEWHQALDEDGVAVIDTRNSYEYEIGHFKGAVDPKTRVFTQYSEWLKEANIPKEKKILIYCTGGIRCEKAILEMEDLGYKNVYQLDGGILNYLEKFPNGYFNGECFVFDYRVAVNQELAPTTTYKLCPHCGFPGKTKISCVQCTVDEIVCDKCLAKGEEFRTCSKNCAHHKRLGHTTKRVHMDAFKKRRPDFAGIPVD